MNEPTLFEVPSRPVDAERRAILELIAGDRKGGNYGKPCRTYKLRWSAAA